MAGASFQRHTTSLLGLDRARVAGAFPDQSAPRFLICFDRDSKYGFEVPSAVRSMAIRPVRTLFQSPWKNGVDYRWIESCRGALQAHVIAANQHYLKRLLFEYVGNYHEDRAHLGQTKEKPTSRVRSSGCCRV